MFEELQTDKKAWEVERAEWEAEKQSLVREEAVRLLEEEAARRGGAQIDREIKPDDDKPDED